jgi:hypothetical protein
MIPPTLDWVLDGKPTPAFYALILSLFNRTGGANSPGGGTSGTTGLTFLQYEIDTLINQVNAVTDNTLLSALLTDDGAVVLPSAQQFTADGDVLGMLGDDSPPPGIDQSVFMGLLLSDSGGSAASVTPLKQTAVYAPWANGDLPGPTLMATPDGQCVMVPVT